MNQIILRCQALLKDIIMTSSSPTALKKGRQGEGEIGGLIDMRIEI